MRDNIAIFSMGLAIGAHAALRTDSEHYLERVALPFFMCYAALRLGGGFKSAYATGAGIAVGFFATKLAKSYYETASLGFDSADFSNKFQL